MKRSLAGMLALWLALPNTSWAILGMGSIVHDPINTAQNALVALRSLASNTNEITLINRQLQQLANDARNLTTLPLSLVGEIQQTMSTYTGLLNQGRFMVYQAKASMDAFDRLFSSGDIPFSERAVAILNEIRNTGRLTAQVQSVYDELCGNTARMEQLTNASQAAIGDLQALQAGNQLLALQSSQLNGIYQLQATTSRLQTMVYMQQMTNEEQARKDAEVWIANYAPTTLRGPGQGRGPELPQ